MENDTYTAVWVSHSSISDYLRCPRAYYLNNVYKDSKSGHKVGLINPPLALGQAVHEVIDELSQLPTQERFYLPLAGRLESVWKNVTGDKGGFENENQERRYYELALSMLVHIQQNPGPIGDLAVKIKMELPYYWLSKEDNIILCGRIDWLQYYPDTDSVHIIDFKTGKNEEENESLQLPIYYLLATHCQKRPVTKASYWYLQQNKGLTEKKLPDTAMAENDILKIAKKISLARKLNRFSCEKNGCRSCRPLEAIISGKAKFVGVNAIGKDMYVYQPGVSNESEIL